jgi:hypothetical protein
MRYSPMTKLTIENPMAIQIFGYSHHFFGVSATGIASMKV